MRAILLFTLISFQSIHASTSIAASNDVSSLCQTLGAYRVGAKSVMSVNITESKALPKVNKWLVTGEVKSVQPPITFACLMKETGSGSELEKLELFQMQEEKK